jgi:hypothetical protein
MTEADTTILDASVAQTEEHVFNCLCDVYPKMANLGLSGEEQQVRGQLQADSLWSWAYYFWRRRGIVRIVNRPNNTPNTVTTCGETVTADGTYYHLTAAPRKQYTV